jgi:hypothetical protein
MFPAKNLTDDIQRYYEIFCDVTTHCDLVEPDQRSRYSSWLDAGRPKDPSLIPDRGKIFLLATSSKPALGSIQSPIYWVPGGKRPGSEAEHSNSTSSQVKNTWIYTSTVPYAFMAQC